MLKYFKVSVFFHIVCDVPRSLLSTVCSLPLRSSPPRPPKTTCLPLRKLPLRPLPRLLPKKAPNTAKPPSLLHQLKPRLRLPRPLALGLCARTISTAADALVARARVSVSGAMVFTRVCECVTRRTLPQEPPEPVARARVQGPPTPQAQAV